jgi:hypothetical protein
MLHRITEPEFDEMLRSFRHSAFRLETRDTYALGYEEADFERFLAGSPVPPSELNWWRPWLDQIARLTGEGKSVSRVRIVAEPPSDYQRWEMWAAPWHSRAGERIAYLPRQRAEGIGLPLQNDWWLLDDERVILMWFTEDGGIHEKIVISDPGIVAQHCEWRDLAVGNAIPAEEIAA